MKPDARRSIHQTNIDPVRTRETSRRILWAIPKPDGRLPHERASSKPSLTNEVTDMSNAWTHFGVECRAAAYWRVTFNHPPINTITATTIAELSQLVDLIERDSQLTVVVFSSANPDFFLAHYDIEKNPARTAALPTGPSGLPASDGELERHRGRRGCRERSASRRRLRGCRASHADARPASIGSRRLTPPAPTRCAQSPRAQ